MVPLASLSETYYTLLGVSEIASTLEIHAAFRRKALLHHPDKGGNPEAFRQIRDAQETLTDRHKRIMYDAQLSTVRFVADSRSSAPLFTFSPEETLKEWNRQEEDVRMSASLDTIGNDLKDIRREVEKLDGILETLDRINEKCDTIIEMLRELLAQIRQSNWTTASSSGSSAVVKGASGCRMSGTSDRDRMGQNE